VEGAPGTTTATFGAQVEFRQLIPQPATIETAEVVAALKLAARAPADRPYTIANFISSADGRAAFHGHSGPLGDEADRALFHGLREVAEAVFAGTGTLRAERYRRLVRDPERRSRRVAAGLAPEPLMCMVTRSGDVPSDIPMFSEAEARIVVFSAEDHDFSSCHADVQLVRLDPGELTLTTVMRRLRTDFEIRLLLCEGGPTVFGSLLTEGLVDELFLTLAPKLVGGGTSPTISSGTELPELQPLSPTWVLEHSGSLYLRYAVNR
jgi:5-amino-6-(5-phosphoribosylamino)uracil reductase